MKSLDDVVRNYLERIGQLQPLSLGDTTAQVSQEDNQFLQAGLQSQTKLQDALLIANVVLLYALFALGVYLVWHYKDNLSALLAALGGNVFSLLAIVRWLRRLWIEKNATDLFTRAARELSPEQAADLVTTYYNLMMQTKLESPASAGV